MRFSRQKSDNLSVTGDNFNYLCISPMKGEALLKMVPSEEPVNATLLLRDFRRKLIFGIILGLGISIIVLWQFFFYEAFYRYETRLINKVQNALLPEDPSTIMRVLIYLLRSYYMHLITLHALLAIYHGINPILGLKLIINNLVIFSINKVVLLLHSEPRPYWLNRQRQDSDLDGYGCYCTYSNPDMSIIMLITMGVNLLKVSAELRKINSQDSIPKWLPHFYFSLSVVVFILMYLAGEIFLIQMLMVLIYAVAYNQILTILNPFICKMIRASTLELVGDKVSTKNHLLIFLTFVVGEVLVLLGYNSTNLPSKTIINLVELKSFRSNA